MSQRSVGGEGEKRQRKERDIAHAWTLSPLDQSPETEVSILKGLCWVACSLIGQLRSRLCFCCFNSGGTLSLKCPCDQGTRCLYSRGSSLIPPWNLNWTCDSLLSIRYDGNGTVRISGFKKAWQLPLVCSYHVRSPVTLLERVHLERPWRISSHGKRTHKKVNKVPDVWVRKPFQPSWVSTELQLHLPSDGNFMSNPQARPAGEPSGWVQLAHRIMIIITDFKPLCLVFFVTQP